VKKPTKPTKVIPLVFVGDDVEPLHFYTFGSEQGYTPTIMAMSAALGGPAFRSAHVKNELKVNAWLAYDDADVDNMVKTAE
jgi:hypothetical protein